MDGIGHSHHRSGARIERVLAAALLVVAALLGRLTLAMSADSARELGRLLRVGLGCLGQPSGVC
jgi:hypothetical protein